MSRKSPICTFFTHFASYFRAKFKVKEAEIGVAGKGFGLRADWDSRRLIVRLSVRVRLVALSIDSLSNEALFWKVFRP